MHYLGDMKFLCSVLAALLFGAAVCGQGQVQRWNVDGLRAEMGKKRVDAIEFLNEKTVHARMRRIGAPREDTARYDLACVVVGGRGEFRAGRLAEEVREGTILYVPKDSIYGYFDIGEPIEVMEWASPGEMRSMEGGGQVMRPAEPVAAAFTVDGVGRARVAGENVWNAFVRRPSMVFGLYMLPKSVGGDSALVHKWDEINLIARGTGRFQVGRDVMDVRPGDIVYVRKGNAHYFHSLEADLDILIFFEMKSIEKGM